jgi:hypothetical protein
MHKEALDKLSNVSDFKINDELFSEVDQIKEEKIPTLEDEFKKLDREREVAKTGGDLANANRFEYQMKNLGLTKDDIIDMVLQLSDDGYIEEEVRILDGKITALFRTSKMKDSREFVETFDEMNVNTRVKTEYYINLFALASVLARYKDQVLSGMTIIERIRWIEDNLDAPIYKILLDKSSKFLEKIELLSSEEVADFF